MDKFIECVPGCGDITGETGGRKTLIKKRSGSYAPFVAGLKLNDFEILLENHNKLANSNNFFVSIPNPSCLTNFYLTQVYEVDLIAFTGDTVTFECGSGKVIGNSTVTCNSLNTWYPDLPLCSSGSRTKTGSISIQSLWCILANLVLIQYYFQFS